MSSGSSSPSAATRSAGSPAADPAPTVVGFDTASGDTAVCAAGDGETLYESLLGLSDAGAPQHSTGLLGEIERAAEAAGGWTAVDRIAVGTGPGSFTGLRVGIATARALALGRGLPLSGVGSLDALGRGIGERADGAGRLAVLDARRGEVCAALYSRRGERLWGPLLETPEGLARRIAALPAPVLCAGSGAVRFRQQLTNPAAEIPDDADPVHRIAARHVCALAAIGPGEDESDSVAPIYLRPPDAQRWRERDRLQAAE